MRSNNNHRHGGGGTNVDVSFGAIIQPVEQCASQLKQMAEILASSDKNDFDAEFVRMCKDEVLNVGKETTTVFEECEQVKIVLRDFQSEQPPDAAALGGLIEDGPARAKRLKADLDGKLKNVNIASSRLQLLPDLTAAFEEEDVDDEIQIQRSEETASDYTCPVTLVRMVKPMKNAARQGGCKHIVCNNTINHLFMTKRGTHITCPIPGCGKTWHKNQCVHDTAFEAKMERFFRLQSQQSQEQPSSSSAHTVY